MGAMPLISSADVGYRIAISRAALGLNQSDVARRLRTQPNKVSQWESGTHLPSLPAAVAMCNEFGLTLDWIFRNDKASLTRRLADLIDAFIASGVDPATVGRPFKKATSSPSRANG